MRVEFTDTSPEASPGPFTSPHFSGDHDFLQQIGGRSPSRGRVTHTLSPAASPSAAESSTSRIDRYFLMQSTQLPSFSWRDVAADTEEDFRSVKQYSRRLSEYRRMIKQLESERDDLLVKADTTTMSWLDLQLAELKTIERDRSLGARLLRSSTQGTFKTTGDSLLSVDDPSSMMGEGSVVAIRVYTDSKGIPTNRFSALFRTNKPPAKKRRKKKPDYLKPTKRRGFKSPPKSPTYDGNNSSGSCSSESDISIDKVLYVDFKSDDELITDEDEEQAVDEWDDKLKDMPTEMITDISEEQWIHFDDVQVKVRLERDPDMDSETWMKTQSYPDSLDDTDWDEEGVYFPDMGLRNALDRSRSISEDMKHLHHLEANQSPIPDLTMDKEEDLKADDDLPLDTPDMASPSPSGTRGSWIGMTQSFSSLFRMGSSQPVKASDLMSRGRSSSRNSSDLKMQLLSKPSATLTTSISAPPISQLEAPTLAAERRICTVPEHVVRCSVSSTESDLSMSFIERKTSEDDSLDGDQKYDQSDEIVKSVTYHELDRRVLKKKKDTTKPSHIQTKTEPIGILTRNLSAEMTRGLSHACVTGLAASFLEPRSPADIYLQIRRRFDGIRPIRVLSLDGGGLRACVTGELLKEFAKGAGDVPIHQCFDLIVGTSAGGVMTTQIAKLGWDIPKMAWSLDVIAQKFFGSRTSGIQKFCKLVSQEQVYDTKGFRDQVHINMFGSLDNPSLPMLGRSMDGKGPHCAVTVVRSDLVPWRPYLFRSYDLSGRLSTFDGTHVATVTEAFSGTTSAPFVMKPFQMKAERIYGKDSTLLGKKVTDKDMATFLDGGVWCNNPTMAAYFEAKDLFGHDREIILVSLGTGHLPKKWKEREPIGWLKLGGELGHGLWESREVLNNQVMRQLLREEENFFRFDLTVEKHENDKASLMPYYQNRAKRWLRKYKMKRAQLQALGKYCSKFADDILPEFGVGSPSKFDEGSYVE